MITNRIVNIFNDNVMAYFRKILKHQQKKQTLDKKIFKRRTTTKQISPELNIQRIVVEKYKEHDLQKAIMEGDYHSKQKIAPLSIMSYVLSE